MNPHWLQGFPRRPRRWRDRPDQAPGAEDKTGPNAGHTPQCPMRGRLWILPPDAPVIQSGGPTRGERRTRARTPSRSTKGHGPGGEVRIAAGCRLRFSAAARTQAPDRPRPAGAIRSHSSAEMRMLHNRLVVRLSAYRHRLRQSQALGSFVVHVRAAPYAECSRSSIPSGGALPWVPLFGSPFGVTDGRPSSNA
jgi:hypothetical protein